MTWREIDHRNFQKILFGVMKTFGQPNQLIKIAKPLTLRQRLGWPLATALEQIIFGVTK
jgi:hypothetical protein